MKQRITIRVPIGDAWDAGSRVQVYTNSGSGAVDTDTPLLAQARAVFPGRAKNAGFGRAAYGGDWRGAQLPTRPRNGGHGDYMIGRVAAGLAQPYVEVTVTVPPAFGVWKFAVKATDAEGNAQSGGLDEIERLVSGLDPRPLTSLAYSSYDDGTDQFTFAVTD